MSPLDDWDLEAYRVILRRRSDSLRIDPRVQVRFDESDLVQETLLRAADPNRSPCDGVTDGERLAWLFSIQEHLLFDKYDEQFAQKRDPRREVVAASLRKAFDDSTADLIPMAGAKQPGVAEAAELREELELLEGFLDQLTVENREVLLARRNGLTIAETSVKLGVTPGVVAGRLVRATKQLLELTRSLRKDRSDG